MTLFSTSFTGYLQTLVVDSNVAAANQLAEQLSHSGFAAEVAASCHAAQAAARAKQYEVFVVVADLNKLTDMECLSRLRIRAPRTWIIVLSSEPHPDAAQLIRAVGADSLLTAPFSLEELTFRLSALSKRSRPP